MVKIIIHITVGLVVIITCWTSKVVYSQDNLRAPTLKYKTLKYKIKNTSLPDLFFESLTITKAPALEDPTLSYQGNPFRRNRTNIKNNH